jgi:FkbM family methyltransferase
MQTELREETVSVTALGQNFKMNIYANAELFSQIVRQKGRYSKSDLLIFQHFLKPGSWMIDVGAHIGWYSLCAARCVGPTGQVLAFEPTLSNRKLLIQNLEMNGLRNVMVKEQGLGDFNGVAEMTLSFDNSGDHCLISPSFQGPERRVNASKLQIKVSTLDQHLSAQEFARVSLIKIDAQGSEPRILTGMLALLEKHRPPILMEYSPSHIYECGSSPFEIFSFIEKNNYVPFLVHDDAEERLDKVLSPISIEQLFTATREFHNTPYGLDLLLLQREQVAKLQAAFPEPSPPELLQEAQRLSKSAQFEAAESLLENLYQKLSSQDPWHPVVEHHLHWYWLRRGRFKEGMRAFLKPGKYSKVDWGFSKSVPELQANDDVQGRKVLILHANGGAGDEIINFRFAADLKAQGAEVIWRSNHGLENLFRQSDFATQVINPSQVKDFAFDFWTHTGALVELLDLDLSDISRPAYLRAPASLQTKWSSMIPQRNRLRVGLRWQGNMASEAVLQRSIPYALLRRLFELPNIDFYSLQLDSGVGDIQIRDQITDLSPELRSWEDTAAAIQNLDLVISCCTSIAHLAGALGVKTWVLPPLNCFYIWALPGDYSPWYPNLRIFRQNKPSDWQEIIEQVSRELQREASASLRQATPVWQFGN